MAVTKCKWWETPNKWRHRGRIKSPSCWSSRLHLDQEKLTSATWVRLLLRETPNPTISFRSKIWKVRLTTMTSDISHRHWGSSTTLYVSLFTRPIILRVTSICRCKPPSSTLISETIHLCCAQIKTLSWKCSSLRIKRATCKTIGIIFLDWERRWKSIVMKGELRGNSSHKRRWLKTGLPWT